MIRPDVLWYADFMVADRFPISVIAIFITLLVGAVTGPLAGNANPATWLALDKIFGGLGDRLDRLHRPRADLVFRGFILSAVVVFFGLFIGKTFHQLTIEHKFHGLTEALLLSLLISSGSVWFALLRLYFALESKKAGEGGYYAISRSMRRNLNASDDFGITRIGMSYAARAFDKGLVAPVFWYLIGGLPLALIYSCIAGLAWRFGKDGFTKGFGAVPLALERLLGFVPSVFAAVLLSLASIVTPTAGIARSMAAWTGVKGRAPYEQGGMPLSVMAWALRVSLGGASQDLGGGGIKGAWAGPEGASAQLNHKHLRRALYMSAVAHFLFLASLGGAYVWAQI